MNMEWSNAQLHWLRNMTWSLAIWTTNLSASIKDGNVELVPVRVADQDVAVVGYVNTVWEEGDVLGGDTANQLTVEIDHNNSMSLK